MWYRGEGLSGGREGGQGGGCCNEIQEEGGAGNTVGRDKVRLYQFKKKVINQAVLWIRNDLFRILIRIQL